MAAAAAAVAAVVALVFVIAESMSVLGDIAAEGMRTSRGWNYQRMPRIHYVEVRSRCNTMKP